MVDDVRNHHKAIYYLAVYARYIHKQIDIFI